MAFDPGGVDITCVAGMDLSAYQYCAVTMESDGEVDAANSAGEQCIGILQNKPAGRGEIAIVRISGISKVRVAAALNPGTKVSASATGALNAATAGQSALAITLIASTAPNDIVPAVLANFQIPAEAGNTDISLTAGMDLSGKQYYAVTMETDGKVDLGNYAGERCIGILQNAPSGDGQPATVRINGITNVVAAGAFNPGVELSTTSAGKLNSATAGHYVLGLALDQSAGDGSVVRMVFFNNGQKNA